MQRILDRRLGLVLLGILLLGATARVLLYGDMRFSVGNAETQSYISSSRAPAFSWESLAGKRLLTTNLLFKLANDPRRCPLTALSNPAEGREVAPILQPCFDRITVLQSLLSILCWCYLAWTTARWFQHPVTKIGIVVLLLLFAFTPQIAEWDRILSPESLAMSLGALVFALLQEIVYHLAVRPRAALSPPALALAAAWLTAFILWVFTRDVHLVGVVATIALLAVLVILADRYQRIALAAGIVLLLGMLVLGYTSARDSRRATHYALVHALEEYVLPFPQRLAFFSGLGMPPPTSGDYPEWLDRNAAGSYAMFLVSHPRFVLGTLWEKRGFFGTSFLQQYFPGTDTRYRGTLLAIGELLHPETNAVYLLVFLLLGGLCMAAIRRRDARLRAWTWLLVWLLGTSSVVMMTSFFGDTEAYRRHLYPSVESIRLLMWLLVFFAFDEVVSAPGSSRSPASP